MASGTGLRVFDDLDVVLEQKRRGDSWPGAQTAGGTAGLEVCPADVLRLRHRKTLPGAQKKMAGDILAAFGHNPGPARQNIIAVAPYQVRSRPRCGQAAQLFRADRKPVLSGQHFQTGWGWPEVSVITGTEPGQAGTDKNNFMQCV